MAASTGSDRERSDARRSGRSPGPVGAASSPGGWPLAAYFLLLVGLFVAAAAAAAVYVSLQAERDARSSAEQEARFAAQAGASQLGKDIAEVRTTVAQLVANPQIGQVFAHPKGCTLSFAGSGSLVRGHVEILRSDGTLACSSPARTGGVPLPGYRGEIVLARARQGAVFLAPI